MCFYFYFGVVMYRGHIIAQCKNMFDIADIHGDKRGGQDFLDTLYNQPFDALKLYYKTRFGAKFFITDTEPLLPSPSAAPS
jgi:hypothetical protein